MLVVCSLMPVSVPHLLNIVHTRLSWGVSPAGLQDESLNFEMLSPLSSLVQLRCLGLQGSDAAIPELAPWHQLQHSLTRVDLHGSYVSDLRPLLCLTGLQQLDLGLARQLKDLGDISKLVSLTQLNLKGCAGLTDLQPVQLVSTMRELQQP